MSSRIYIVIVKTIYSIQTFQPKINNNSEANYTSSKIFSTSKIHQFENLPEPRNATEGMINNDYFFLLK